MLTPRYSCADRVRHPLLVASALVVSTVLVHAVASARTAPTEPRAKAESVALRGLDGALRGLDGALAGEGGGAGGASPCSACVVGAVGCGAPGAGTLAAGECLLSDGSFVDAWTFTLATAASVTVEMTSTAFDTFLFVTDAGCNVLGTNDDCMPGNLDSCITIQLVAGDYFLIANSFAEGETGAYRLAATCGDAVDICGGDCPATTIGCDETRAGTLDAADCALPADGSFIDMYELVLAAPTTLSLRLTSAAIDPYLWVFDASCAAAAQNDDCTAGDLSLSCLDVDLPAGTWFIGVNSFAPGETGAYELQVTADGCEPPIPVCEECNRGNVECGASVTDTLGSTDCTRADGGGAVDYWQLVVAADAEVTIRLESTVFDPVLALRDSGCELVAENDDCDAGTLDSCVEIALTGGTYWIEAASLFAGEAGDYTIRVDCGGGEVLESVPGDCNASGAVELADAVCLFGFLFLGGEANRLPCTGATLENRDNATLVDWNGDTRANLSDGIGLLNYLVLGGAPHALGVDVCVALPSCPSVCGR